MTTTAFLFCLVVSGITFMVGALLGYMVADNIHTKEKVRILEDYLQEDDAREALERLYQGED